MAFHSTASNLVATDANGVRDVFVRDLPSSTTRMASVLSGQGAQVTGASSLPAISQDGEYVTFESTGIFDLFDTNGVADVLRNRNDCTFPELYCSAKTTSNGCLPQMFVTGTASVQSYTLTAFGTGLVNKKNGLLFYGLAGKAALPFQGGTLCVQPPTKRTPIQSSGGSASGSDCSGTFVLNLGAFANGSLGGFPLPQLLVPGTVVNCQWWGRDPGYAAPNNTMLSNALEFTVLP